MLRVLVVGCLLTVSAGARAESYICLADLSTGFSWSGTGWQHARFTVKDDRFLVEATDAAKNRGHNYLVKKIGSDRTEHQCDRHQFQDGSRSDRIICGGLGVGFSMDTKTLRFQSLYGIGFLDGGDSNDNTPSLTIGRCTRLKS